MPYSRCGTPCGGDKGAIDSVVVRIIIRAPTNAKSFSLNYRYFYAGQFLFSCGDFDDIIAIRVESANSTNLLENHVLSVSSNGEIITDCSPEITSW